MVSNSDKESNLRIDRARSAIAYGGWVSQVIVICHYVTLSSPELAALANKILDVAALRSKAKINEALEEKVRFELNEQGDPSKLLHPHYFEALNKTYKHTYRVAKAAELGAPISLWTRIDAAIEIQREVHREARRMVKQ